MLFGDLTSPVNDGHRRLATDSGSPDRDLPGRPCAVV